MTTEEALVVLNTVIKPGYLNRVQELVFRQAWEGKTYSEIADNAGYDSEYIKYVGFQLWRLVSQKLGEKVTKSNVRSVLRRWISQSVFEAVLGQKHCEVDATKTLFSPTLVSSHQDWGEAMDVSIFYGRIEELDTLKQWIVTDRCRLVTLLGMGGIGKTALAIKLVAQIQDEFDYLIWRSLRNAPPVQQILIELLQFFCNQLETYAPQDGKLAQLLMNYLRQYRCLLVFDNMEAILRGGDLAGYYLKGYEGYGELLRCVGEVSHQSCLILTSREKPREFASLEGETSSVRSLRLIGMKETEGKKIFKLKGSFSGSEDEWRVIIHYYAGNPLILKMVISVIQFFFDSSISNYVEFLNQEELIFDDVRNLLEQQFNRLANLEKEIMYWLAINREPASLQELQKYFTQQASLSKLIESLSSLERRSLIETNVAVFTQQPVIMKYITERLSEQNHKEVITKQSTLLMNYAPIKS